MNKSDLKNLIKSTIEEILQEKEINVTDKKDIPKDLEDDDIVNISKDIKKFINKDKTQSDKLKNVGDRFKSKPVTLKDI
jgi:galactitol-specific phosphotransferase system IIB component|tara:strand:- start:2171 stop:2407 length:237 start_codon:yes stop_codon:yes gene_type:complete